MQNNFFLLIIFLTFFTQNFARGHEIKEKEINKIIEKFIINNPRMIENSLINFKKSKSKEKFVKTLSKLKKIPNPSLNQYQSDLTIYEFFDYNCGYCKVVMQSLFNVYHSDKKISIVFVELPILSETSVLAALASLAADKQKRYTDFHIKLMKNKGKINENVLFNIAKSLKLNLSKFKNDFSNDKLMSIVNLNREIAKDLNLRGTPAFLIGNSVYAGAMSEEDLIKAIKFERKKLKN